MHCARLLGTFTKPTRIYFALLLYCSFQTNYLKIFKMWILVLKRQICMHFQAKNALGIPPAVKMATKPQ